MPLYDYQCARCKAVFEVRATFKEKEAGLEPQCPRCNSSKTHQLLTLGMFLRQGEGGASASFPSCEPNCGRSSCANCRN